MAGLFPDAILLWVIERKAKGITKCSKGSLGGVGLGPLQSELVGLTCRNRGCFAGT